MRCDTDVLEAFADQLRAFESTLQERLSALRSHLAALANAWQDENFFRWRVDFERVAAALAVRLSQLHDQAGRLGLFIESVRSIGAPAASSSVTAVKPTSARVAPVLPRKMTRLSIEWFTGKRIDWGEADFGHVFDQGTHHGHTASDYLALARRLPLALETGEGQCWEAFTTDPIAIEVQRDGQLNVLDGRHRLMACLRQGVAPVVLLTHHEPGAVRPGVQGSEAI